MSTASSLRFTARGRRVLGAAAIAFVLIGIVAGGRAAAGGFLEPVPVDTYTVGSGETLWAIAAAYTGPSADVRDTIDELVELNGLSGTLLRAGEQILVPAS